MYKNYLALEKLNANRARLAVLDAELPKLRSLADTLQADVSIRTVRYGDDTGSIHATGSHGDPTQRRALEELPDDVRQLLDDIRAMTIERHRTAMWIEMAEQALSFLQERERIIVEPRAVERMSWFDVVDALFDRTGDMITERTARRTFDRAMSKIEPFFISNPAEQTISKKRIYARSTV